MGIMEKKGKGKRNFKYLLFIFLLPLSREDTITSLVVLFLTVAQI